MDKPSYMDTGVTLYDLMMEIQVVCPRCQSRAFVQTLTSDDLNERRFSFGAPRRLICPNCCHRQDWQGWPTKQDWKGGRTYTVVPRIQPNDDLMTDYFLGCLYGYRLLAAGTSYGLIISNISQS